MLFSPIWIAKQVKIAYFIYENARKQLENKSV